MKEGHMERSRQKTKERILESLGNLLARQGFANVGINTVAREAGCDKVLIYRYFGGMEGLFEAFARWREILPQPPKQSGDESGDTRQDFETEAISFLSGFARTLRDDPVMREIMIWELLERNSLTDALAKEREKRGLEVVGQFSEKSTEEFTAAASIISAGITYLALRGKTADVYNGIELTSEEGWEQIEKGIDFLVRAVAAQPRQ